jgi:hypothetical protein
MADLGKLPLLSQIPPPDAIRDRLAELARERALLRALLKVSRRKEAEGNPNARGPEVAHAAS